MRYTGAGGSAPAGHRLAVSIHLTVPIENCVDVDQNIVLYIETIAVVFAKKESIRKRELSWADLVSSILLQSGKRLRFCAEIR